ncbi:MAG: type II toxin-antitoxin system RelE/ParE family toxin [Candidatus Marinimicrobia bacterium]|nr:type II toxin-antitoxin system RelE/ParE family toxin [Candidatus Neomarinimicrobiota bacterium]
MKPAAVKDLKRIAHSTVQRVGRKISSLAAEPRPPGAVNLKLAQHVWRLRVGDYRVLYTIDDDLLLVTVARVRHRRDIYRQL